VQPAASVSSTFLAKSRLFLGEGPTLIADYGLKSKFANFPGESMADTTREVAHIGKSVVIKGELSGSEDLFLDGEVEGSIELKQNSITVGANGRVKAKITAKSVVLEGKVNGNVFGSERVEIRGGAVVNGDIVTKRIVIAEGAYFKGSVNQEGEPAGS
jgi:cytoskeletal protein CcmA (bactofilin family)